jgi:hypothetical protein
MADSLAEISGWALRDTERLTYAAELVMNF